MLGTLVRREFGAPGFYVVSAIGGLLSSASAVAAAASMGSQGAISPSVAGTGAVIPSLTSLTFSLSFVLRSRDMKLVIRFGRVMLCVAVAAAIGLPSEDTFSLWLNNGSTAWCGERVGVEPLSSGSRPVTALP